MSSWTIKVMDLKAYKLGNQTHGFWLSSEKEHAATDRLQEMFASGNSPYLVWHGGRWVRQSDEVDVRVQG